MVMQGLSKLVASALTIRSQPLVQYDGNEEKHRKSMVSTSETPST